MLTRGILCVKVGPMQALSDLWNVLQGKMELWIQNNHAGTVKILDMNYQTVSGYKRKRTWRWLKQLHGHQTHQTEITFSWGSQEEGKSEDEA